MKISCAELVDVEANPLGKLSLSWNERCSKETSEAACVHVGDAHEKSSNPDDHETERSSEWTRDLETISGRVGASEQRSISSDADAIAAMSSHGKQRSSLGGVGTSCTSVLRRRIWTQSKQQHWRTTHRIQSGATMSD